MSLSRLETSRSTPPFLQLYFLRRLKTSEICHNSFIMLGRALCGNGFIHLNLAEIHEDNIGGQKKCAYFADQGSKWAISGIRPKIGLIFLKRRLVQMKGCEIPSGGIRPDLIAYFHFRSCLYSKSSHA